MYMQAHIKLSYGGLPEFLSIAPALKKIAEAGGWKLRHAILNATGRVSTVLHIWEVNDMAHYEANLAAIPNHPDFPAVAEVLARVVVEETLTLGYSAPYA